MLAAVAGLLVTLMFAASPVAFLAQQGDPVSWHSRLYLPQLIVEPNRHTPQYTGGTYLPPTITDSRTLTAADNPVILSGHTTVVSPATLRLDPGVTIVAHEFASLIIAGQLIAEGTTTDPIILKTNEAHPDNQTWGGIILESGGQARLSHLEITEASPGLSCRADSTAIATAVHINNSLVGFYTESPECQVTNSHIQSLQYGVVARHTEPSLIGTVITAGHQTILKTNLP